MNPKDSKTVTRSLVVALGTLVLCALLGMLKEAAGTLVYLSASISMIFGLLS